MGTTCFCRAGRGFPGRWKTALCGERFAGSTDALLSSHPRTGDADYDAKPVSLPPPDVIVCASFVYSGQGVYDKP